MKTVTYTVLDIRELATLAGEEDWGKWYKGEYDYYYNNGEYIEFDPKYVDIVIHEYENELTTRFYYEIAKAIKEGKIPSDHTVLVKVWW